VSQVAQVRRYPVRNEFGEVEDLDVPDGTDDLLVAHEHLARAGDARPVPEYELELIRVPGRQGHRLGSRTHQRHMAKQHIYHLRQLIETAPAQERAQPCHPAITRCRHLRTTDSGAHSAELKQSERTTALPDPALPENRGTAGAEAGGQRDGDQERQRHPEDQYRDREIEEPAAQTRADSRLRQ
jgi:hypothetical protein